MNQKEKLQDATVKALTSTLDENKASVDDIFEQMWSFDNGKWYIDYYKENGPMDKDDFINTMMSDGEFDYSDQDMVKVYGMIYDKISKDHLEEANQNKSRKELIVKQGGSYKTVKGNTIKFTTVKVYVDIVTKKSELHVLGNIHSKDGGDKSFECNNVEEICNIYEEN